MAIDMVPKPQAIIYPDSDGMPMAENTLQFRWIVTIQGGLDALFAHRGDVFVAGDLLWYPVEGEPKIRLAPDALVAFGRPKGYRGSYKQWEEDNIPPQVVFEVLSPNNTPAEMRQKLAFYEKYGVEECYYYDPEKAQLTGWQRQGDSLKSIPDMQGWISPRLKIRFDIIDGELQITRPDGQRFLTYVELVEQHQQAQREKEQALQLVEQQAAELARLRERLKALGQSGNG